MKSFEHIQADYRFFEEHVSERAEALAAWSPWLTSAPHGTVLDFGCGSGSFTAMVLERWRRPAQDVHVQLVEPVDTARTACIEACGPYTVHPVEAVASLSSLSNRACSIVLCHHVLYYIPNLEQTLQDLLGRLAPHGVMLAVVAAGDSGPGLLQEQILAMAGLPTPYGNGLDIRDLWVRLAPNTTVVPFWSEMRMADTRANREAILRFLVGEFQVPWEQALSVFDPFTNGSEVVVPSQELALVSQRV